MPACLSATRLGGWRRIRPAAGAAGEEPARQANGRAAVAASAFVGSGHAAASGLRRCGPKPASRAAKKIGRQGQTRKSTIRFAVVVDRMGAAKKGLFV
jgi:hypothetical protein